MKKLTTFLVVTMMALSVIACSHSPPPPNKPNNGRAEEVGKKIDYSVEQAKIKAHDLKENVKEKTRNAADYVKEKAS